MQERERGILAGVVFFLGVGREREREGKSEVLSGSRKDRKRGNVRIGVRVV